MILEPFPIVSYRRLRRLAPGSRRHPSPRAKCWCFRYALSFSTAHADVDERAIRRFSSSSDWLQRHHAVLPWKRGTTPDELALSTPNVDALDGNLPSKARSLRGVLPQLERRAKMKWQVLALTSTLLSAAEAVLKTAPLVNETFVGNDYNFVSGLHRIGRILWVATEGLHSGTAQRTVGILPAGLPPTPSRSMSAGQRAPSSLHPKRVLSS